MVCRHAPYPGTEVWAGQGMGVLLVGSSQAAAAAAALAVEQALPRDCRSCLLVFKVCCESKAFCMALYPCIWNYVYGASLWRL